MTQTIQSVSGDKSPQYIESADSSSATSSDDDDDDDDGGGGGGGAGGSGGGGSGGAGGSQMAPIQFTGESQFEYATQDQDHGAPEERRTTHTGIEHQGLQQAYWTPDSSNERQGSSSPLLPYVNYPVGEVTHQPTRWVYEWEDPEYYQMLVESWSTTSAWTGQTWVEYKAQLMRDQGIMLLSTEEYNMAQAQYQWNAPWE